MIPFPMRATGMEDLAIGLDQLSSYVVNLFTQWLQAAYAL